VWPFDAGTLKGVVTAYAVPIGAGMYPMINFILKNTTNLRDLRFFVVQIW
jgi:hypothetical protein